MAKSNATVTDFLNYTFNGTLFPWNSSSSLYIALHTADPTASGNQSSNETNYTNYARQPTSRSASAWGISTTTSSNTNLIQFPQCGITGAVITYVSIGLAATGGSQILYSGSLNASLTVANLIQPQFSAGALTVTEA